MRVIINNNVYGMTKKQLSGLLKIASKQISFGIYAVIKDDICELRKDKFENKSELAKAVSEYKQCGFEVKYND